MTFSTHEQYDENEYFVHFLRIHPYLTYANNTYDKKKLELQLNLLNKFNDKIINIEELKTIYNKIIEKERNENIKIENLKTEHKNIINHLKHNIENEIIDLMNTHI